MEEIILDFNGLINWLKKMTRPDKKGLLASVEYACRGICEFIFNSKELPAVMVSYDSFRFEAVITANYAISRFYKEFLNDEDREEFILALHDILGDDVFG